ncbi:uncharacterized protein isoform X1 [Rhodnius prolixus]|uniref:O-acyltransferase WSD1 C-terminal domain-containing protein n=1 Tax=Rhodnius prolixus TaxID=13249 RepID=A0ABL0EGE3_RHOPR
MGLELKPNLIKIVRKKRYNLREKEKTYRCDYETPSGGTWPNKQINFVFRLLSAIYTFFAFLVAICLIPWLFTMFIFVRICRIAFVSWLENKFQGLEFVQRTTVRTAVDTPRNQGIITVLLTVQGPCQLHFIKNRIQTDIIEREKNGRLVFPHLRTMLTSRWGNYAWIKGSEKQFRIDNQIVLASGNFKGRPVSDTNIQEYVSDIIAKLLPQELPPWQITVIPTQQDKTYLLIRLHHLYLSEDGLSLGELLLLRNDDYLLTPTGIDPWADGSVLAGVFKTPVVIPQVYEQLCECLANWWNELLSAYDPSDGNTFAILRQLTLKTYIIRCIIAYVSVIKEYMKDRNPRLREILKKEIGKRNLTRKILWRSIVNTFDIYSILHSMIALSWKVPIITVKMPVKIIRAVLDTPVYLYWLYLAHYVIKESVYLIKIFYTAPRVIFEEIFLPEHPRNVHELQTLSFCGRKVVNWSEPVPLETVKEIQRTTGATTSEVVMSAVSSSLRDYFISAGFVVPHTLMTTCHFTPRDDLFSRSGHVTSGMLCLQLPTETPCSDPIVCLKALQKSLYKARSTQAPLYLASVYQFDYGLFTTIFPTLFAKACLYLLSRRYTVTVTQIDSPIRSSNKTPRELLWGQRVDKIMYWRPPQANVGLSLTVIRYDNTIQLGVMSDAQLLPYQSVIANSFPNHIYKLSVAAGAPQTSNEGTNQ